ncbi:MAG: monovalent cation/hydrogen antiporter, partial [Thermoleophilaceae bacterium]|nr:monovalent cation/hydrogen antiporter [Thermoleophilaceae bacterium]
MSAKDVAETIVLLLGAGVLLAWLSVRFAVPYPVMLVGAGGLLAFVPGIPSIPLEPELVLMLFVAPLLFADAFFAPLHELRRNAGSIARLASILVLVTAGVVGVAAHFVVGLPWAVAFTLGAALGATDSLAPTQILGREGADPRLVAIVRGESIFNDGVAFALVSVASAAAVSSKFDPAAALGTLALSVVGGIVIGLAVAWITAQARQHTDDVMVEAGLSLLTPFAAYIAADAAHGSGILAAVAAGLYLGRRSHDMVEPLTRVEIESAWKIISFVLNSLLFLLVGLQMREIVNAVSTPAGYVAIVAVVIVAAVVGIRLLWSLAVPAAWRGARGLAGREVGPATSRGWRFALGWSGPRGAVALAAALSLPMTVHGGGPTPGRDLVIVLTLIVIVATLGGQGLTLRPIIRRLGLTDPDGVAREEARAKHVAAEAALGRLDEAADRHDLDDEQRDWLEREYAVR